MAFKVLGGDLAKRLLGVGVIWPKDYLVLIQQWHQGVFWPDHPNTKESCCQITPQNFTDHFPEFTFSTKESSSQTTVELRRLEIKKGLQHFHKLWNCTFNTRTNILIRTLQTPECQKSAFFQCTIFSNNYVISTYS